MVQHNNFQDFKDRSGLWVKSFEYRNNSGNKEVYRTRAYLLWMSILSRTRGKNSRKASYVNTVNSFESFQEFAEWCQDQYGYLNKDEKGRYWQLDKDLLYFGNNAYSPTTCVFIPVRLNSFIPASPGGRIGQFLQGVSWHIHHKKFRAASSENSKILNLGLYDSEIEAHRAWQKHKIQKLEEFMADSTLEPRVINAIFTLKCMFQDSYDNYLPTIIDNQTGE